MQRPEHQGTGGRWIKAAMVTLLMGLAVCMTTHAVLSQPAPPTSPIVESVSPDMTYIDSLVLKGDSIVAREILIDPSGVTITDSLGRHIRMSITRERVVSPRPRRHQRHRNRQDVVHLFADVVTVEKDEVVHGDVVCVFGGRIDVQGRVDGSVISVFGSINVDGQVGEDAVSPFGTIRIGPDASIAGDAVASVINKEPGGRIGGVRSEIYLNPFASPWQEGGEAWARATVTALVILKTLFLLFLVLLAHALAARNIARVKEKIASRFIKSFLLGILAQVLIFPVFLLLLVTIIGIPVALFLLPLLMVADVVLSLGAFGLFVGQRIDENTALKLHTPLARTLAGLLVLQSVSLAAVVFMWMGGSPASWSGPFRLLSITLYALWLILGYVVFTTGTGAVIITRFGTRPCDPAAGDEKAAVEDSGKNDGHASRVPPTPLPHPRTDESSSTPTLS